MLQRGFEVRRGSSSLTARARCWRRWTHARLGLVRRAARCLRVLQVVESVSEESKPPRRRKRTDLLARFLILLLPPRASIGERRHRRALRELVRWWWKRLVDAAAENASEARAFAGDESRRRRALRTRARSARAPRWVQEMLEMHLWKALTALAVRRHHRASSEAGVRKASDERSCGWRRTAVDALRGDRRARKEASEPEPRAAAVRTQPRRAGRAATARTAGGRLARCFCFLEELTTLSAMLCYALTARLLCLDGPTAQRRRTTGRSLPLSARRRARRARGQGASSRSKQRALQPLACAGRRTSAY